MRSPSGSSTKISCGQSCTGLLVVIFTDRMSVLELRVLALKDLAFVPPNDVFLGGHAQMTGDDPIFGP